MQRPIHLHPSPSTPKLSSKWLFHVWITDTMALTSFQTGKHNLALHDFAECHSMTMISANDCSCPFSPAIPCVWEKLLLHFHKTKTLPPPFRSFLGKSLFCRTTQLTNHSAHHYHLLFPYLLLYNIWVHLFHLGKFCGLKATSYLCITAVSPVRSQSLTKGAKSYTYSY